MILKEKRQRLASIKKIGNILTLLVMFLAISGFLIPNIAKAVSSLDRLSVTREGTGDVFKADLQQNYGFGENTAGMKSEAIFITDISAEYGEAADNDTYPTGSYIYEKVSDSSVFQIKSIKFYYLSAATGATAQIYLNDATTSSSTLTISSDLNGKIYNFPAKTYSYKIVFDANVKMSSWQTLETVISVAAGKTPTAEASSEIEIFSNQPGAPVVKKAKTNTNGVRIYPMTGYENEYNSVSFPNLGCSGFGTAPYSPGNMITPNEVSYNLFFLLGPKTANPSPVCYSQTYNTKIVSRFNKCFKLKRLFIPKDFAWGKDGVVNATSTFDLYIDNTLYKSSLSTTEEHSYDFSGLDYKIFELKFAEGTMFISSLDRRVWPGVPSIIATYNYVPEVGESSFNNLFEIKTDVNGKTVSSLDTEVAAIKNLSGNYGIGFLRLLDVKDKAEKTEYKVGEDIVFELSEINAGKYIGDYYFVNMWIEDSKDLDNYYIKKIELISKPNCSIYRAKNTIRSKDGLEKIESSKGTAAWLPSTLDNTTSNEKLDTFEMEILMRSIETEKITSETLKLSDYQISDSAGGLSLKDFKIRITYGQKVGRPVTEDTIFNNKISIKIAPNDDLKDPMLVANEITAKTKILIPRYKITYNANGGTGTLADISNPYKEGDKATVLSNNFSRKNYKFLSWNSKPDGKGESYTKDEQVTMDKDLTLYAQWESIYDKDGFDEDGYDKDGYDKGGYDRDGYDRDGYDRDGYDKDGNKRSDPETGDQTELLYLFAFLLFISASYL
ncbi:MAG: InlB B-repeat-containing protein, partial [Anaerovoracaceae bacterium]